MSHTLKPLICRLGMHPNHGFAGLESRNVNIRRSVIARRTYQKNEDLLLPIDDSVVLDGRPLVAMQFSYSKRCGDVCSVCLRWVGDLRDHVNTVLENVGESIDDNYQNLTGLFEKPHLNKWNFVFHEKVTCDTCSEIFCSDECKDGSEVVDFDKFPNYQFLGQTWHTELCTTRTPYQRAVFLKFSKHAMTYHEPFLLAARAYAIMLAALRISDEFFEQTLNDFKSFHSISWDQTCGKGNSFPLNSTEGRLQCAQEAFSMMEEVFSDYSTKPLQSNGRGLQQTENQKNRQLASGLFSLQFFLNLLGTFEMCNVKIEYFHPFTLTSLNRSVDLRDPSTDGDEIEDFKSRCGELFEKIYRIANCCEDSVLQPPWDQSMFPDFFGIGLYPYVALMNHSCDPNVDVEFNESSLCSIIAKRPIQREEEICISYIDQGLPLSDRRDLLLQEYSFFCKCERCEREQMRGADSENEQDTQASPLRV